MNIYEKLGIIQSKLKAPKGQYNSFGKYKYRSCEDILEAVKPLLAETKTVLSVTDRMEVVGDRIYVRAEAHFGDMAYVVSDASWKCLLSGKSGNTSAVEEPWEFDITIPTNAKYIQISYSTRYPSIEFEMYEEKGTLFEMVKKIDDNLNEVPNENPLSVIR